MKDIFNSRSICTKDAQEYEFFKEYFYLIKELLSDSKDPIDISDKSHFERLAKMLLVLLSKFSNELRSDLLKKRGYLKMKLVL